MRKPKSLSRKSKGEIALHLFVAFLFFLLAVSYVYLLVWAFLAGLKTHTEIVVNPFSLPQVWHWEHYLEVFSLLEVGGNNFFDMLFNSVYFSVGCVFLSQFITMSFAYCCTKYKFPGSDIPYDMKLWWVHNECLIATLLAYHLTGDIYYEEWYKKLHDYVFAHFPDEKYGEWYGYLYRDGTVSHTQKGSLWKGPFHLPRCLMLCEQILEAMEQGTRITNSLL